MAEDYTKTRDREKMPKGEMKELKDNTQDGPVYSIPTDTEKEDLDRLRYHSVGNKGYPRQAFRYDY